MKKLIYTIVTLFVLLGVVIADEICEIPPLEQTSVERIENRDFPSVALWPEWNAKDATQYDYLWGKLGLMLVANPNLKGLTGNLQAAEVVSQQWIKRNPNAVFLYPVSLTFAAGHEFPEDSDVWFRDPMGKRVSYFEGRWGGWHEYVFDIAARHVQEKLVAQILSVAKCGLFEGIAIDGLGGYGTGYFRRVAYPATDEAIINAIVHILREVRSQTSEDFLIVINSNQERLERYAEYINGNVMEADNDHPNGYTHERLEELDSSLLWHENNLRFPQINWSEGFLIEHQPQDSPDNKRWVRLFTVRSMTHANGYVSIHHEPSHVANEKELWYRFWDAPLGRPIGGDKTKGVLYQTPKGIPIEGLFIREFTGGWAVYNRSGKERRIQLPEKVSGWASGETDKRWHTLGDLDGEIYLKAPSIREDVNGDGVVNILDLVMVANAFGGDTPDLNADGVVNILDLVQISAALE